MPNARGIRHDFFASRSARFEYFTVSQRPMLLKIACERHGKIAGKRVRTTAPKQNCVAASSHDRLMRGTPRSMTATRENEGLKHKRLPKSAMFESIGVHAILLRVKEMLEKKKKETRESRQFFKIDVKRVTRYPLERAALQPAVPTTKFRPQARKEKSQGDRLHDRPCRRCRFSLKFSAVCLAVCCC
jgi:hypothetical protein